MSNLTYSPRFPFWEIGTSGMALQPETNSPPISMSNPIPPGVRAQKATFWGSELGKCIRIGLPKEKLASAVSGLAEEKH